MSTELLDIQSLSKSCRKGGIFEDCQTKKCLPIELKKHTILFYTVVNLVNLSQGMQYCILKLVSTVRSFACVPKHLCLLEKAFQLQELNKD